MRNSAGAPRRPVPVPLGPRGPHRPAPRRGRTERRPLRRRRHLRRRLDGGALPDLFAVRSHLGPRGAEGVGCPAVGRGTAGRRDQLRQAAGSCGGGVTRNARRALLDEARHRSVRELAALAGSMRAAPPRDPAVEQERRSLRCNEAVRTMTVQLPPESFAEARCSSRVDGQRDPVGRRRDVMGPADGRRLHGADPVRKDGGGESSVSSPYFVVVHVPVAALLDESGDELGVSPATWSGAAFSTSRRCAGSPATPRSRWPWTTTWVTRCTRAELGEIPTGPQHREVRRRDRHCRFPGCTQRGLHERAPHQGVETRPGTDGSGQFGLAVRPSSRARALQTVDACPGTRTSADLCRPERPRHGVAPLAAVDRRDGSGGEPAVAARRTGGG